MRSWIKSSAGNFLTAGVAGMLSRLVSLITISYLIRTLGPAPFGKLGFSETLVTYFMLISDLGLQTIGLREIARISEDKQAVRRLVSTILVVQFLFTTLLFGIIELTTWFILAIDLQARLLITLYGIGLLFPYVFTIEWWLNGTYRLGITGIGRLIRELLFLVLTLLLVHTQADLLWVPLAQGLAWVFIASLICIFFIHETNNRSNIRSMWDWGSAQNLLQLSWPIAISGVISHLWIRSGIIHLGMVESDSSIGLYNAAWRIFAVGLELTSMGSLLVIPWFSRLAGVDDKQFRQVFRYYQALSIILAVVSVVIGTVLRDFVITLLFGDASLPMRPVFSLLMIALGCWMVSSSFFVPLIATRFERTVMLLTGICALICIGLNFLLIPVMGSSGAALALATSMLTLIFLSAFSYVQLLGRTINVRPVLSI